MKVKWPKFTRLNTYKKPAIFHQKLFWRVIFPRRKEENVIFYFITDKRKSIHVYSPRYLYKIIVTVYSILKKHALPTDFKLNVQFLWKWLKFLKSSLAGCFFFYNIFEKIPRFKILDHSLGTKSGRYTLDTLSIICLPFGILVPTEPIHL